MVTAEQAAKLGAWGVIASVQPNFDALWGGDDGMYAQRLGADRARRLNPLALLASQGVPLAFGSDAPVTGMNPWATVRAAARHQHPGQRDLGAGGVRGGHPRRVAGGRGARRCRRARWCPAHRRPTRCGMPTSWRSARPPTRCSAGPPTRGRGCPRCPDWRRRPAAALPADGAPRCRHPWLSDCAAGRSRRRRHDTCRRGTDETRRRRGRRRRPAPTSPADGPPERPVARLATGCPVTRGGAGRWCPAAGSAAVVGGLLLCLSFPPFGWWYAAIVAFALLAWVLTRAATTPVGGFGYGFLFGLAFYLPLLPWISGLVGPMPWLALALLCRRCFPALFGLSRRRRAAAARLADLVRAGCGRPQEWLKSTVPFGGFPWGVVGFGQTDGPLLPLAQLGGAPLLSFAVALLGFSLAALALEIVRVVAAPADDAPTASSPRRPRWCCPVSASAWCCSPPPRSGPQVRHSGAGCRRRPSVTVAAVQGNVPRLGLEFNAQRRAVLDNHVRETLRLAEDVRAGPGAATAVRHLAGELVGHRPAGQPGRRRADRGGRRRDQRADPGRRRARRARLHAATTRCRPTRSSSGIPRPAPATGTTSRSCSRSASTCRGELLPAPSVVRGPGRLFRPRQRQRRRATPRACRSA